MKKLALLLLLLPLPAHASTFTLDGGSFNPTMCDPVCTGAFDAGPEAGAIADNYIFTVTGGVLLHSASATNASAVAGEIIDPFNISLFSGTPTSAHTLLATGAPTEQTPTFQSTGGLADTLNPGNYFLEVTGTNAGEPTTYAGSFSFSPSPVPIPGALWLFGAGLIGLWRMRYGKAR